MLSQLVALGADVRVADSHVADHYIPSDTTRVDFDADAVAADAVVLLVAVRACSFFERPVDLSTDAALSERLTKAVCAGSVSNRS